MLRGSAIAFAWSMGTYVALVITYLVALRVIVVTEPPIGWFLLALLFLAPVVSGFIWAWRTQSQRLGGTVLLAAVSSICLELLNLAWTWMGFPTDAGKVSDAPWMIGLSFLVLLPLTMIGAGLGIVARKHAHA
jgi:hypothetical protein